MNAPHTIARPWIAPEHIARIYGDEEQAEAIRGRVEDDGLNAVRGFVTAVGLSVLIVGLIFYIVTGVLS